MIIGKFIVAFAAIVATSSGAFLRDGGRSFLAQDIVGNYKFFVNQGSCASPIDLLESARVRPGVYSVPHNQIKENGKTCNSKGTFVVVTKDVIVQSGNEQILKVDPLAEVVAALEEQGATFMVGFEETDRKCGPSTTPANSIAIFVEEEKNINIPGHITLRPGAKYMIMYDPTSPTPCTYFSKDSDRVIGVPMSGDSTTATAEEIEETAEAIVPVETMAPTMVDEKDVGAATATTVEPSKGSEVEPSTEPLDTTSMDDTTGGAFIGDTGMDEGADDAETSESPESETSSACFPSDATVEVEGGLVKRMDEVKIGDRVKVASGEYSSVYMFSHKISDVKYSFVELTTCCGTTLSLTKGHYLYVNGRLAAAESVRVGDSVMTENGIAFITGVATVTSRGLYNPQTISGDIMVNGIKASTYTTTVESKAAHSLLAPVRAIFGFAGITTTAFENGADSLAKIVPSGSVIA